ncbi:MarR family transcriptional regulator [Methylobacterium sp. Leaf86]|uniref:MarR family winged helix-turn-helix transcriptional regulator n=1 Tax=Methylobacterium sp. Leaf86 TaxID=1736242 RepID=UPI0006F4C9E0|nr:MarR family winged helix-turn-helix transcriptional regulator [Methylobacterium sp. Leaf86]KQO53939.1 MarR family transcriptional regulator [Methylobacterium sp. Leaf86]
MAGHPVLTPKIAAGVEQACFSFAAQKAARAIGRRYDAALRPTGLSNWQFTLLMMLVRVEAPTIGVLAQALAMDRTTITANVKPLERRGLLRIEADADDRRVRRILLTDEGRTVLAQAYPLWEKAQAACAEHLGAIDQTIYRAAVAALTM